MFIFYTNFLFIDGDVYTFGMNNKGQCGRDFPAAKDFQLPTASSILSSNVSAMEAPEDINSDHDIDTEHESSLSEVINCSFFKIINNIRARLSCASIFTFLFCQ